MSRYWLLMCLAFFAWSPVSFATPYNVLVVHSYHQGMFWTDSIQHGIDKAIRGKPVSLQYTYLDSKRYQSGSFLAHQKAMLAIRLENGQHDAILATDNNALNMLSDLSEFIGDTPVFFSGYNGSAKEVVGKLKHVTGVREELNLHANVDMIHALQPEVKRLYLLLDNSNSSQSYWERLQKQLETSNRSGIEVIRLHDVSFTQLIDKVRGMESDEAVFYVSFTRDNRNEFRRFSEVIAAVAQESAVPMYVSSSFMLGTGAVGGVMIDGEQQGYTQGKMMMNWLENGVMEPVRDSADFFALDASVINKMGIDASKMKNVVLINSPKSWWTRYGEQVKLAALIVGVLGGIILLLSFNLAKLRRSQAALKDSQTLFAGVFDQSNQVIALLDSEGNILSFNRAFEELVSGSGVGSNLFSLSCWNNRYLLEHHFKHLGDFSTSRFEALLNNEINGDLVLDIALKRLPMSVAGPMMVLFEGRDVTERKLTEEKLRRSEIEFRTLYEQQPVMLMTIDNMSRIQSVNHFAAELLGMNKSDLLGHKVTQFYGEDAPSPQQQVARSRVGLLSGTGVLRRDICYHNCSGEAVWIRESIRPMPTREQFLLVGEDITANRQLEAQLLQQARHDYLTGLYNRSYFEQALTRALDEVHQGLRCHAMFYIDLDQFKVINDTAGHQAGDEALKQVALILKKILPEETLLARLGGDEFAIIYHNCSTDEAMTLGRQILYTLNESEFLWSNVRLALGGSIGLRMLDDTAGSPQQVHAQADTACYVAKDEGGSRIHMYRPEDEELKRREQEMACVNQIRAALAEDRFELFGQKIVGIDDSDDDGIYAEVLIRMRDEQGKLVSPGLFIPAAERYNVAHLIDRVVVEKTFALLENNPAWRNGIAMLSINLSGRSMGNQEFTRFLTEAISSSPLPSEKICLEITETAAISSMSEAISLFSTLKALGCRIALDDFGSGLSSFGYLKRLPVDIIKLDGQFVRDVAEDEMDFAMVTAINGLARQMGKKTVAEFVESAEVLEKLMGIGVNFAQGYLFSVPGPLETLLREHCQEKEKVV